MGTIVDYVDVYNEKFEDIYDELLDINSEMRRVKENEDIVVGESYILGIFVEACLKVMEFHVLFNSIYTVYCEAVLEGVRDKYLFYLQKNVNSVIEAYKSDIEMEYDTVMVVEFDDYRCNACRKRYLEVLQDVKNFIDWIEKQCWER